MCRVCRGKNPFHVQVCRVIRKTFRECAGGIEVARSRARFLWPSAVLFQLRGKEDFFRIFFERRTDPNCRTSGDRSASVFVSGEHALPNTGFLRKLSLRKTVLQPKSPQQIAGRDIQPPERVFKRILRRRRWLRGPRQRMALPGNGDLFPVYAESARRPSPPRICCPQTALRRRDPV